MTRFRAQVIWRAAALSVATVASWLLPQAVLVGVDRPQRWLGSVLIEAEPLASIGLLVGVAAVGFCWQLVRPADMGALAWVVAGGALAMASVVLILLAGSGPVYWWLATGVAVTSMVLQVLAAVVGHGAAVVVARGR